MGLFNEITQGLPGNLDAVESFEMEITWGRDEVNRTWVRPAVIASTAVDAGNTPTTHLRAGLLMGVVSATGEWKEWDSGETDGTEVIQGVLVQDASTSQRGTAVQQYGGWVMTGGQVMAARLLVPGAASHTIVGDGAEAAIRTALAAAGFTLDDTIYQ